MHTILAAILASAACLTGGAVHALDYRGYSYPLLAREPGSAQRTCFDSSDAIYPVMPDRFASGSANNDSVPVLAEDADRKNPACCHGGAKDDAHAFLACRGRQDVVLSQIGLRHWWMKDMPVPDWTNHGGKFVPTMHHRVVVQDKSAPKRTGRHPRDLT